MPRRTPSASRNSLRGAMIAVVDDEASVLDGMHACFTQWGATVTAAASCAQIIDAIGDTGRYPDLIVADYRLAGGELGTDVIAHLREEFGTPVPALLVSGDASAAAIEDMRASGLRVLLKPVIAEELRVTAEGLIDSDRARSECHDIVQEGRPGQVQASTVTSTC